MKVMILWLGLGVIALLVAILINVDHQRGCSAWFISASDKAMCTFGFTQADVDRRLADLAKQKE